jgi:hypothetical protein
LLITAYTFTREMDRFIKKYIEKHPDWMDLIKPNKNGRPE